MENLMDKWVIWGENPTIFGNTLDGFLIFFLAKNRYFA